MKVLHVNEHLAAKGGIETYMLSLMPRLEALGHEQAAVYASGECGWGNGTRRLPILSDAGFLAEREGYRQMAGVLREERPDLVHLHNIYNVGAIRACLDAAPTVLHAHDYRYVCPASNYYHRRSQKVCERTAGACCLGKAVTERCMTLRPLTAARYMRRVQWVTGNAERFVKVIAPSDYCRGRLIQAGFEAGKVVTLPYFCPIEPLAEPRALPERPTVLFMGRASAYKGYRTFVDAVGRLPKDVRGRMVGSFSDERAAEIRGLARRAGCEDRLDVGGWVGRDAVVETMRTASAFAFTSLWAETLGIVGLEAMACGVPVAASDVGGVRQWLEDRVNGRLVPPGNADALAEAVGGMLASRTRLESMGRAGIATIQARFRPERHVGQLLEQYMQVKAAA